MPNSEKRPSKYAPAPSGGGRRSGGIISKWFAPGLNTNFGADQESANAEASIAANKPTNVDTKQLYNTPTFMQRLFAPDQSAAADAANANLFATQMLSKQQFGNQMEIQKMQDAEAYRRAMDLQGATAKSNLAQAERIQELQNRGAIETERERQKLLNASTLEKEDRNFAGLGRSVWDNNRETVPYYMNPQTDADFAMAGRVMAPFMGAKGQQEGVAGLGSQITGNELAMAKDTTGVADETNKQELARQTAALYARPDYQKLNQDTVLSKLGAAQAESDAAKETALASAISKTGVNVAPGGFWHSFYNKAPSLTGSFRDEVPVYDTIGNMQVFRGMKSVTTPGKAGMSVDQIRAQVEADLAAVEEAKRNRQPSQPVTPATPVNPYRAELEDRNVVADVEAARAQASDYMTKLRAINARIKAGGLTVPMNTDFGDVFSKDTPEEQKKLLSKAAALEDARIKALSSIKGRKLYSK